MITRGWEGLATLVGLAIFLSGFGFGTLFMGWLYRLAERKSEG